MHRCECWLGAAVVLPLLVSHVAIRARGDDRAEHSGSRAHNGSQGGHYVGDHCQTACSAILQHAFCNRTSHRCQCSKNYPVIIDSRFCEKPRHLEELCRYDKVCHFSDLNSECRSEDDTSPVCQCRSHYLPTPFQTGSSRMYCVKDPLSELLEPNTPTLLGMLVGVMMMTCLICLVLRLFYRARHARSRGYGDASIPPPLTLSEVSTPTSRGYHRCTTAAEPVRWNGVSPLDMPFRPQDTAVSLAQPESDQRRHSSGSVHSSFSTCTYGLPESIVTRLKAQQRQNREYHSQQLPQEDDSLDTSSVSLEIVRGRY